MTVIRAGRGAVNRLYTVEEAAEYLNTSERFVRRLVAERRIPFHKVGRYIRITETDLAQFVNAGRVDGLPPVTERA
jgi:excisionase family DNA binding protein